MDKVEYDLDTSGGIMEEIERLVAPPVDERKRSPSTTAAEYKRTTKAVNRDRCDACKEDGDLLCCDQCPASFHLQCCDPPLEDEDVPTGEWICSECKFNWKKQNETRSTISPCSSRSPSPLHSEFQAFDKLTTYYRHKNPNEFKLPESFQEFFVMPGDRKRKKPNEIKRKEETHRTCFTCTKTERVGKLINCDFCPLVFHQDCLMPPLAQAPVGLWMCPNHPENFEPNLRLSKFSERGKIIEDLRSNVNQNSVKLDFLSRAKKERILMNRKDHQPKRRRAFVVPDIVKAQYRNPPAVVAPPLPHHTLTPLPPHMKPFALPTQEEKEQWLKCVVDLQCSIASALEKKKRPNAPPAENNTPSNNTPSNNTPSSCSKLPTPSTAVISSSTNQNTTTSSCSLQNRTKPNLPNTDVEMKPADDNTLPTTKENNKNVQQSPKQHMTPTSAFLHTTPAKQILVTSNSPVIRNLSNLPPSSPTSAQKRTTLMKPPATKQQTNQQAASSQQINAQQQPQNPSNQLSQQQQQITGQKQQNISQQQQNTGHQQQNPNQQQQQQNTSHQQQNTSNQLQQNTNQQQVISSSNNCGNIVAVNTQLRQTTPIKILQQQQQQALPVKHIVHLSGRITPVKQQAIATSTANNNVRQLPSSSPIRQVVSPNKLAQQQNVVVSPNRKATSVVAAGQQHLSKLPVATLVHGMKSPGRPTTEYQKAAAPKHEATGKSPFKSPANSSEMTPSKLPQMLPRNEVKKVTPNNKMTSLASSGSHMVSSISTEILKDPTLSQLDDRLVRILAFQRLQQLVEKKSQTIPKVSRPGITEKRIHLQTTETKKAIAVFSPLNGLASPTYMRYRTFNIGQGADMDLCLGNYGFCNYVSSKHATVFFDKESGQFELLNYSEHGSIVDNVLYSCDFSEKPRPLSTSSNAKFETPSASSQKVAPIGRTTRGLGTAYVTRPCSCRASASSLIGGSGAGWEGTAVLHHGSYVKLGCLHFVFSLVACSSNVEISATCAAKGTTGKAKVKIEEIAV